MKLSQKEKELFNQAFNALVADIRASYADLANADNGQEFSELELLSRRFKDCREVLELQTKIEDILNDY